MVCETAQDWYHGLVSKVNEQSSSGLLCQVVVLNAMRPRRLSPKVILQISLWSVIIIVVAFIALYSFLLTYMNRHILVTRLENGANAKDKYSHGSSRVKFRSKGSEMMRHNMDIQNITLYVKQGNNSLKKMLWRLDFDDVFSVRPSCKNNTSLLTILITSTPDHFQQRAQIRKTWCSPSTSGQVPSVWQCIFLIGQTDAWEIDNQVEKEAENFKDILRGTYFDSYRNLTFKVLHGLDWSSRICAVPYTLKTDDDCFVNTVQLYNFLSKHNHVKTKLYVGNVYYVLKNRKVIRNIDNKWFVSRDSYAPEYYPPYASGVGYVLSWDMVQAVVTQSQYITPIPNEDAFLGIVVHSLGLEPVSSERFTLFSVGFRLCNYIYVLVSHGVKPEDQIVHHDSMMRAQHVCRGDKKATSSWS